MLCQILINVKQTNSLLSHEQIEIWLNQCLLFCCSVKGHLLICKLQTSYIPKSQLLYLGCPITRECAVQLQECVNTEFDKAATWGIEKSNPK